MTEVEGRDVVNNCGGRVRKGLGSVFQVADFHLNLLILYI